jgi:hypothetical protein
MEVLAPVGLNTVQKVFLASIASWVVGLPTNVRLRGTIDEIKITTKAMIATRRFDEELGREGASLDSIMQLLNEKHNATAWFERTFGLKFPL